MVQWHVRHHIKIYHPKWHKTNMFFGTSGRFAETTEKWPFTPAYEHEVDAPKFKNNRKLSREDTRFTDLQSCTMTRPFAVHCHWERYLLMCMTQCSTFCSPASGKKWNHYPKFHSEHFDSDRSIPSRIKDHIPTLRLIE
jgi:hypothetical protein